MRLCIANIRFKSLPSDRIIRDPTRTVNLRSPVFEIVAAIVASKEDLGLGAFDLTFVMYNRLILGLVRSPTNLWYYTATCLLEKRIKELEVQNSPGLLFVSETAPFPVRDPSNKASYCQKRRILIPWHIGNGSPSHSHWPYI